MTPTATKQRAVANVTFCCRERPFINVLGETIDIFDRNPAGEQTFSAQ